MKKIFLVCLASSLLFCCNNSSSTGETSDTTSNTNSAVIDTSNNSLNIPTVSKEQAELMIYHFLSSSKVDHSKDSEIQRIEFDGKGLKKLLEDKKTDRLRLFTAAYREDYMPADMRNKKTILLQLKKGDDYIYYDIIAITSLLGSTAKNPICPPPSGVCDLNFASTLDQVKAQLNQ